MQGGGGVPAHRPAGAVAPIAADPELDCGPSTVRNELALLEEYGLLAHPHVSAGRVPTDAGHRYVVDRLLSSGQAASSAASPDRAVADQPGDRRGRAGHLRDALADDQPARVVSAPSPNTATIRHVEVLALQPQLVLVVIITSTGGVSKMLATFERPRRSRAAGVGRGVPQRAPRRASPSGRACSSSAWSTPACRRSELAFLERFAPAFAELASEVEESLYVEGTARLLESRPDRDTTQGQRAGGPARAPRGAAAGAAHGARRSRACTCASATRTSSRRCTRWRWWRAGYGLAQRRLGTVR